MGKKIRVIVALLVIVGVTFWSINLVRTRTYSGSAFAFRVGSGAVSVNNLGQEHVLVEMRSDGSASSFRIVSAELDLRESSRRQTVGSSAYHAVQFELPAGQATIDVTRGSNVWFLSGSEQRIDAVVTPLNEGMARAVVIGAIVVAVLALYYISRTYEHQWVEALRNRLEQRAARRQSPESTST